MRERGEEKEGVGGGERGRDRGGEKGKRERERRGGREGGEGRGSTVRATSVPTYHCSPTKNLWWENNGEYRQRERARDSTALCVPVANVLGVRRHYAYQATSGTGATAYNRRHCHDGLPMDLSKRQIAKDT